MFFNLCSKCQIEKTCNLDADLCDRNMHWQLQVLSDEKAKRALRYRQKKAARRSLDQGPNL